MRIAKTTGSILLTLGYSLKAVDSFRQGKYGESLSDVVNALKTVDKSWNDIDYTWNQLRDTTNAIIGSNHSSAIAAAQAKQNPYGFFTGKWKSSDRHNIEFIYYGKNINAIFLYSPRATGPGYNVYTGGIDLERA